MIMMGKNGFFTLAALIFSLTKSQAHDLEVRASTHVLKEIKASHLVKGSTASQQVCFGEYSTCDNGSCSLTKEACNNCQAGQYACPLSTSCFSGPTAYSTCPGLAGTHFDTSLTIEQRLDYIFQTPWTLDEYVSQMTENATSIPRLSIPDYSYLNDDQHGVKNANATAFPNGNSLGASWDVNLLHNVGLAIGTEARGIHNSLTDKSGRTGGHQWPGTINNGVGLTLYAPNVNLVHDPRWGRAQEVMSECPKLTGDLVYAYVTGLQNNSETLTPTSPPLLTVACCKHYAVYNVETIPTDRHHFNAVVNARDLWETYLPVFEQCINKAKGQSIMCSYNEVNGIPACANGGLITDVARGAFSFDGFVMSDYDAWQEMVTTHAWAANWTVAAVAGLSAGLDQEGGGGPVYEPVQIGIPDAFNTGLITLANLTVPVRRLMRARLRLGMFDPPASVAYNYLSLLDVASPDKVALAEKAARAGITLLKNTGSALPLSLSSGIYHKIALVGPNANSSYGLLGSYSDPFCCGVGIPSILQELSYRVAGAGVDFSYGSGCVDPNCVDNSLFGDATRAAANADAVVIAIGMGNSNYDCGGASNRDDCEAEDYDRPTCALPGKQAQLVAAVKSAMKPGAPLIAVLIHGSSLCIDPTTLASLDAVLAAWYPGERGGPAIADALIGAFSPAGRSPVSWYASDAALPSDRGQMSPYEIPGVSPGITYRFYNQSSPLGAPLLFTFGQGLTYSTFSSSNPVFPTSVGPCDDINVTVTVTNTGSVDSDIVVALFLAQPDVTVPTPLTRLVSFIRVHIAAKNSVPVTLPAVPKEARFVVHDDGTSSVYDIAQKRWNEQGRLNFHVSLGEYGSDMSGSSPFTVQQSSSQNIDTC